MAKVTQSTIAKRLGISRQAVGCALGLYTNTNIKLNEETRERIIQTAAELGYRPNRLAQIISGRKSGTIGVMNFGGIAQMSAQNAYHVASAIHQIGYQMMLYDVTWYHKDDIANAAAALLDNRVEGIVMISPTNWMPKEILNNIQKEQIPVVSLGGVFLENVPHIEASYKEDTYQLTKALLGKGYRSFVYLTSWSGPLLDEMQSSPNIKRMLGFRQAITEHHGVVEEHPEQSPSNQPHGELYYSGKVLDWSDPYEAGYLGMQQLLQRRQLPDVVMCSNDDWATGALRACGNAGLKIPEDMAVTGNDGTIVGGYGYVPLTTIVLPQEQLARTSLEILQKLINRESLPEADLYRSIPGHILWRSSTKETPEAAT